LRNGILPRIEAQGTTETPLGRYRWFPRCSSLSPAPSTAHRLAVPAPAVLRPCARRLPAPQRRRACSPADTQNPRHALVLRRARRPPRGGRTLTVHCAHPQQKVVVTPNTLARRRSSPSAQSSLAVKRAHPRHEIIIHRELASCHGHPSRARKGAQASRCPWPQRAR
jgi:hypothetical protein